MKSSETLEASWPGPWPWRLDLGLQSCPWLCQSTWDVVSHVNFTYLLTYLASKKLTCNDTCEKRSQCYLPLTTMWLYFPTYQIYVPCALYLFAWDAIWHNLRFTLMVDPQKQQYEQKRLKYNVTQVQPPQTWQGECYGMLANTYKPTVEQQIHAFHEWTTWTNTTWFRTGVLLFSLLLIKVQMLSTWQTHEKLVRQTRTRNLHEIEYVLFDVRNSHEKYLAASRYDTRTSFCAS